MKLVPDGCINTKAYYFDPKQAGAQESDIESADGTSPGETIHCNPWDIELLCDYISQTVPKSLKKKQLEA